MRMTPGGEEGGGREEEEEEEEVVVVVVEDSHTARTQTSRSQHGSQGLRSLCHPRPHASPRLRGGGI